MASALKNMIQEGRVITQLEFEKFYLVTVLHTKCEAQSLSRLAYRQVWEDDFLRITSKARRDKTSDFSLRWLERSP